MTSMIKATQKTKTQLRKGTDIKALRNGSESMSINHDMLEKEEDSDFHFISSENVTHTNKRTETEGSD
jgi:hypothetical protein